MSVRKNDLDIIYIDNKIKEKFNEKYDNLGNLRKVLSDLEKTFNKNIVNDKYVSILKNNIESIKKKISNIEENTDYNYYILESIPYIEEYKKIINTPIKMNFIGKIEYNNKDKTDIVKKYLDIVYKYTDFYINVDNKKTNNCLKCNENNSFDITDNNTCICINCGMTTDILCFKSSYKDTDRVNISNKYSYDRKIHFRDCMNQYQGKQNCTIEKEVYEKLEKEFDRHHLLLGNINNERDYRFSKISKKHVFMFLKELNFNKHYENINLIHYNLTGVKPDDITHLEEILLNDFDELTLLYDKKYRNKITRINFINTHHVLYQLLKRHNHICKKEDFSILKTIERQTFHDNIMEELFVQLNWKYERIN